MKYSYWNELQRYNQRKRRDAQREASLKIFAVCFFVIAAYLVVAFVQGVMS